MDNIKTLFKNQQYQLIIDLFSSPKTGEEAFYLVNSFIQQVQYKKAIDICVRYRKQLFDFHPLNCLRLNFDLRFTLKEFDEAYKDLESFQNFPYVNQEVEEYLRTLHDLIRTNEKASFTEEHKFDISSIKNDLENSDDYKVLLTLDFLSNKDFSPYADLIISIIENKNRHQFIRSYALMLLVSKAYDKDISVYTSNKIVKINPKNCKHPFTSKNFFLIHDKASRLCKNISIMKNFDTRLANYQIAIFPYLVEDENVDLLIAAILSICSAELCDQIDKNSLITDSFTVEELDKKIKEIKNLEASIPTI